jgi:hypothetical protein
MANPLIMATGAIWLRARSRRASPYLADLLDLPASFPQFPVELRYRVNDATYGADDGIVSFVDGWLHFQGRRTSWSLHSKDAHLVPGAQPTGKRGYNAFYGAQGLLIKIDWKNNARTYLIELLPLDKIDELGGGLRQRFGKELASWKLSSFERSEANVWPPTQAAPGIEPRFKLLLLCWTYARWLSLATLAVAVVGTCLTVLEFWSVVVGFAMLAISELGRFLTAQRLAAVGRNCGGKQQFSPQLRRSSWLRRLPQSLRRASRARRTRRAIPELSALIDPCSDIPQFPIEVKYTVASAPYETDLGVLSVAGGWIHFRGRSTTWSVDRLDANHVDPAALSWHSFYEQYEPSLQLLHWTGNGSQVTAALVPLDRFPGLQDGVGSRLAAALAQWDASTVVGEGESMFPSARTTPERVRRLETALTRWSLIKQAAHVTWVVGLVCVLANFPDFSFAATSVIVVGVGALITAEYKRGKLAKLLEVMSSYCECGRSLVTFRKGAGPWWRRVGKPWVT